jgi:hypothetical protein
LVEEEEAERTKKEEHQAMGSSKERTERKRRFLSS